MPEGSESKRKCHVAHVPLNCPAIDSEQPFRPLESVVTNPDDMRYCQREIGLHVEIKSSDTARGPTEIVVGAIGQMKVFPQMLSVRATIATTIDTQEMTQL